MATTEFRNNLLNTCLSRNTVAVFSNTKIKKDAENLNYDLFSLLKYKPRTHLAPSLQLSGWCSDSPSLSLSLCSV